MTYIFYLMLRLPFYFRSGTNGIPFTQRLSTFLFSILKTLWLIGYSYLQIYHLSTIHFSTTILLLFIPDLILPSLLFTYLFFPYLTGPGLYNHLYTPVSTSEHLPCLSREGKNNNFCCALKYLKKQQKFPCSYRHWHIQP